MSNLTEIENAVQSLPAQDLSAFREWFARFDAEIWDRQFESDVKDGKLDALADQAVKDLQDGKCTDL